MTPEPHPGRQTPTAGRPPLPPSPRLDSSRPDSRHPGPPPSAPA